MTQTPGDGEQPRPSVSVPGPAVPNRPFVAYPPPGGYPSPPGYQPPGYPPPPGYPQAGYGPNVPAMSPYPAHEWAPVQPPRPEALPMVIVLLLCNLGLSIALTGYVLATKNSLIDYQLDHQHIVDPQLRATLRSTYQAGIWGRVFGNLAASVIYTFLVRALLAGRRWAYRRVLFLSIAGIVGLQILWATPYPVPFRVEQLLQTAVLGLLLYFVTRPGVKEYCMLPRGRRGQRV